MFISVDFSISLTYFLSCLWEKDGCKLSTIYFTLYSAFQKESTYFLQRYMEVKKHAMMVFRQLSRCWMCWTLPEVCCYYSQIMERYIFLVPKSSIVILTPYKYDYLPYFICFHLSPSLFLQITSQT